MSHHFLGRAVIAGLLGLVGMSLGCDKSPSGFNPLARSPSTASPSTPTSPAALTVAAVSPKGGLVGDAVRVTGTGFLFGATVTLGGIAARVTGINSEVIIALIPAHAAGTVDVIVTNPDGQGAMLVRAYTYEVVTLTATPNVVTSGAERVSVSWVAPSGRSGSDWIALFKVGDPSTNYKQGWWQYTNGVASGTVTFSAPTEQGVYEFRYLLDDDFIDVARSSPVTVR